MRIAQAAGLAGLVALAAGPGCANILGFDTPILVEDDASSGEGGDGADGSDGMPAGLGDGSGSPDGALSPDGAPSSDGAPPDGCSGDAWAGCSGAPCQVEPIYVVDGEVGAARIRRIGTDGIIRSIVGSGSTRAGDGGPAVDAVLNRPAAVTFDATGNLYIVDRANFLVRMVSQAGTITTFAGTGQSGSGGDGGVATEVTLQAPSDVAVDRNGVVYIADGKVVWKVAGGLMTPFATGYGSVAAIAVDPGGTVYVADGCKVFRITPGGGSTLFAGTTCGRSGDGSPAAQAMIGPTNGIVVDSGGNVFLNDPNTPRVIRKIDGSGKITMAGPGSYGRFARDGAGNFYVIDAVGVGLGVYRWAPGQQITPVLVVGDGTASSGLGSNYGGDGSPATSAALEAPAGLAVDALNNLFIADTRNNVVREVDATGTITTVAGRYWGTYGNGGPALAAITPDLCDQVLDGQGNLYVSQSNSGVIRKVSRAGTITAFAGSGRAGKPADGQQAALAALDEPCKLAIDGAGSVYVSTWDGSIYRIATDGTIRLLVKPASQVLGLAADGAGNVFVGSSSVSASVTKVTPDGMSAPYGVGFFEPSTLSHAPNGLLVGENYKVLLSTGTGAAQQIAGGTQPGKGDGQFGFVTGLGEDGQGTLYVADSGNHRIVRVAGSTYTTIAGIASVDAAAQSAGDDGPASSAVFANLGSLRVGDGP
jgi:sugar lactone lactonase YvrE